MSGGIASFENEEAIEAYLTEWCTSEKRGGTTKASDVQKRCQAVRRVYDNWNVDLTIVGDFTELFRKNKLSRPNYHTVVELRNLAEKYPEMGQFLKIWNLLTTELKLRAKRDPNT